MNLIKDKGFEFKFFHEKSDEHTKAIYLRHDIDFSLEDAFQIASVEKELNIKSTYFIMLSSNIYNPLNQINKELIRKIIDLGHEISLHFDPNSYDDFTEGFNIEKIIFENSFKSSIKVVSLHRPGVFLNSEYRNTSLGGHMHTYQDMFFNKMEYFSDSRGVDVREILNSSKLSDLKKDLHLLIHPIWWTKKSRNPKERLILWLNEYSSFLLSETKKNCKVFGV